jgi:flagellin
LTSDVGGLAGGTYSFSVDTSAHSITVKDSLNNTVATQTFSAGSGGTDGDPISFSTNGISFTTDGTSGGVDTWAHLKTALEAQTMTVTAAHVDVKQGATVVATQSLDSGYSASSPINFADSGSLFNFSVDTSNSNANTWSKAKSALQNSSFKVVDAHIDVKQGSTTVATQSYTPAAEAAGQQLNFSNGNIAFSVSAGLNTGFSTVATALASQPLVVSSTLAGANSATVVNGNSTTKMASFMIDSSGQYKTNDVLQLSAIDLSVATLGLTNSDLSTSAGASTALSTIDSAMSTVSTALGAIGANQNRISYAQDNLKTKIANFAASESVIRDVDMASEMTTFSANNILAQAGTAMLAQANQSGQSVLKLLQ